jgi:hypothetical protein
MVSRKQLLSIALIAIGVGLVVLGFFQINQYLTSTSITAEYGQASESTLQALRAQQMSGTLSQDELSQVNQAISEIQQTNALIAKNTSSQVLAMILDFVLGIAFLAVGALVYPQQK